MQYTQEELTEAKRQIDSTLHKLQEVVKTLEGKENPARYKSQITLAKRRIQAFTIAGELIEREAGKPLPAAKGDRGDTVRILMLGNSFTSTNHMPQIVAQLTGGEVVHHSRGGARLSEHLNPNSKLGARTQAALAHERWDYVVLQEMSHGPVTSPKSFFSSVERLCGQIRENGAVPILYATWAYQKNGEKLSAKGWDYEEMAVKMSEAYHKAAQENDALIADVGRRFYELSDTQNLYAADGVHPNEIGSRIAAQTIAQTIQEHKEKQL